MIDCDVHPQIGDAEELLAHVEEAQRDWFRGQPYFGLPGYSWTHPSSWYRQDLAANGKPPGTDVEAVQRELLDPSGTDAGVLNADDAVLVSLMPSPYRAAALARAHNDWIRESWLEHDARLRGHRLPGPGPRGSRAGNTPGGRGFALRPRGALRRLRAALRRAALRPHLRGRS